MNGYDFDIIDDFKYRYIDVDLHNNLRYRTEFNLQNTRVVMECGYSERVGSRWVILTTVGGTVLLPQTYIKFNRRCELNFGANMNNLNYYATLKLKSAGRVIDSEYDYLNWSKDFTLCFVGYEYKLQERMNHNARVLAVGN